MKVNMEKMKTYDNKTEWSVEEIANRLIGLSNLDGAENDRALRSSLHNALGVVEDFAENKYEADCFRVLYNVLLRVAGMESEVCM